MRARKRVKVRARERVKARARVRVLATSLATHHRYPSASVSECHHSMVCNLSTHSYIDHIERLT